MIIRQATKRDAPAIAKVHVDSWRSTYKEILPHEYLTSLSYKKRTTLWENNIADNTNYIVVSETDAGQITGFGTASKRVTNTVANSGDLTSIYLLDEYHGQGIGKLLMKALFLHFKQLNYEKIFVEVLEDNPTRFFYEYYGAQLIRTVQLQFDEKVVNELIYEWKNIDRVLEKL
ncbi:GNAT family N-acetyltransferase [Planococcus donghaensis]|uniref:GNAT family N-acetyltransferase n=1 Tax=Planococcus donghaensis TaxID=414778 RepID=A0A1C7EGC7_9BACL|nr:GNAT family N-acetyltransferase [Planococcus donghaensis]ANU23123.1 GNAT family N-acetyltransferase [Planococcus donghaensis]